MSFSRRPSLVTPVAFFALTLLLTACPRPGGSGDDDDSAGDDDDDSAGDDDSTGDDDDTAGDDDDSTGDDDSDACGGSTEGWSPSSETFELRVLELVNERRAAGANCGSEGSFPAVPPLSWNLCLRDSSRLHAQDMAEQDYFSHDSLDGRSMVDRIDAQGYRWSLIGENIAAGSQTPEGAVEGWMGSDGHCANIMHADFTESGVGYFTRNSSSWTHYWVQNFGRGL